MDTRRRAIDSGCRDHYMKVKANLWRRDDVSDLLSSTDASRDIEACLLNFMRLSSV